MTVSILGVPKPNKRKKINWLCLEEKTLGRFCLSNKGVREQKMHIQVLVIL